MEVFASRSDGVSVIAHEGEVESFTISHGEAIGVRVVAGGREGFASAGTLDDDVVATLLDEARENATFAEIDPHAGVAEPDGFEPPALCLFDEAVPRTGRHDKIRLALDLESATKSAHPAICGVRQATYGDHWGEAAVANSLGVQAAGSVSSCHIGVAAMASDGTMTTIASSVDAGRDPSKLDVEKVARDAAHRAARILGAAPVPTRRLPVVFEPRKTAVLVGLVLDMLSGEMVTKGRSPFTDRLDHTIASEALTIVDDPTDPDSLGADTHDGEGLACRRNLLVDRGRLVGFLHNSTTARRFGCRSNACALRGARSLPGVGAHAPHVEPGEGDLESLISSLDEGFLVQSLVGLHSGVNPISGDFSVGAEGLLIRDGSVAEPVREVTLASTLQRVLMDVMAVGADLEYLPDGSVVPTVVIGEMTLAGR